MSLRYAGLFGLLIAAAVAGLLSVGAQAEATFPGGNGKIAFVRYLSGGSHIFVMNADGSGVTQLTESPGYDFAPAWSPDGTKIAFTRVDRVSSPGVQGQYDIAVVNADGSGLTMLTNDPGIDQDPGWSPDGAQIAFSSYREGVENFEIFVMGSDGNGLRQLTNAGNGYVSGSPAWSPDGESIVFVRGGQTIPSDICTMRAAGGGEVSLTSTHEFESSPDWSPDGTTIVFTRQRDIGTTIYLVDAVGGGVRQIIQPAAGEGDPAWSPDGTKIAFVAGGAPSSNSAIWVMEADGTGRAMLAENGDSPAWQPLPGQSTSLPTTPASDADPPSSSSTSCVPVRPPYETPSELPVEGGPPGVAANPLYRYALVLAGMVFAAGGLATLKRARARNAHQR